MANDIKSLSVIDTNKMSILPPAEVMQDIMTELADMERIPMGRVNIAGGGAGVFNLLEPGAEEAEPVRDITGVILMSHRCNAYWANPFGASDDKSPDCSSMDGETGIVRETGETIPCATCPHNQYGSAASGIGKACKNMRRLYILRPGDVLPLILSLPPTALATFDRYRTRLTLGMKNGAAVLTKISLTKAQSNGGITYSTPKFEAVGALPLAEVERVKAYAEGMLKSAKNAGITADDYAAVNGEAVAAPIENRAETAPNSKPSEGGFIHVDDDEVAF